VTHERVRSVGDQDTGQHLVSAAAPLSAARYVHTATLLADGTVLVDDNCANFANPRVTPDPATYLSVSPWATLTGGQRDDDHDGYGNKCDAKFPGTTGAAVGTSDLTEFRATSHARWTTAERSARSRARSSTWMRVRQRRSALPISRSSGSSSTSCQVRSARLARCPAKRGRPELAARSRNSPRLTRALRELLYPCGNASLGRRRGQAWIAPPLRI
jgi:hypothetical protein